MAQRDSAKERAWRQHVARWRRSGLRVRDYCDSEGISEPSFYSWRRVLAERDHEEGRRPAEKKRPIESTPTPPFLPVHVVTVTTTSDIEIVRNGWVLRVRSGFDAVTLRQVLDVFDAGVEPRS